MAATAAALQALAAPASSLAVEFNVNTTADGNDFNTADPFCDADAVTAGEQCTLRAAIQQAVTPPGEDMINVPAGSYTYDNALGRWLVNSPLIIDGAGAASTVLRQAVAGRIIEVAAGASLDLRDVTVRDGVLAGEGAGIFNFATLILRRSTLLNNQTVAAHGGGIYSSGTATRTEVIDSTIGSVAEPNIAGGAGMGNPGGRGGGIAVDGGDLIVTRSLIEGNQSNEDTVQNINGGGIYASLSGDQVSITDSTIRTNQGNLGSGGGIHYSDFGGSNTFRLDRSAVVGNTADPSGGGMVYGGDSVVVADSTFSGNTANNNGGALSGGDIQVNSSTFAGNVSNVAGLGDTLRLFGTATFTASILQATNANCSVPAGTVASGGYNIESGTTCGFAGPGDASSTNANLGALADNGGPTPTHAVSGPPAVDRVPAASCTGALDQRGFPRPSPTGGNCDSGAYELFVPTAAPIPTPTPTHATPLAPAKKKKCKKKKRKKGNPRADAAAKKKCKKKRKKNP